MTEILEKIRNSGLTPNQYLLLYSMVNKLDPPDMDVEAEMKILEGLGHIREGEIVSRLFDTEVEEVGFHMRCVRYSQCFPPIVLPSGVHARGKMAPLKTKMKAFIKAFPYDWDLIYTATEKYVNRYAHEGYKYMQNAPSFIFDKNGDSTLALECDTVLYMDERETSI